MHSMLCMSWIEEPSGSRSIMANMSTINSVYILIRELDKVCSIHVRDIITGIEMDPERGCQFEKGGNTMP